jgi:phosphate-selective porin OprO/OprP
MSLSFWKKLGRFATGSCAALLLATGTAEAADPATEDLKAQLDRQQKQIEYLQRVIEQGGVRPISEGNTDRVAIEQIVENYLKGADKKPVEGKKEEKIEWMEVGRDRTFAPTFNNGLHFATKDGAFRVALRGRWNNDWGWAEKNGPSLFSGTSTTNQNLDDGVIFRRARLGLQGTIWEVFDFVAEFDFSESYPTSETIGFREVWVGVNQLPYIGTFRVGHFKEPYGLEHLTSSRYITFIERTVLDQTFIGDDYNPGFIVTNTCADDRIQWALCFSRTANNAGSNDLGDGRYNLTGRVTALPVYANDGRCLVHVGASARWGELSETPSSTGTPGAQSVNLRSRTYRVDPQAFAQTGTIFADNWKHYGVEFLAIMGPFSLQAEAMRVEFDNAGTTAGVRELGDPEFFSYYVFGTYSLTGEHRQYNRRSGAIDRPIVYEPFFLVKTGEDGCEGCCWGKGAWEIAARYAYLDLLDDGFSGNGIPVGVAGNNATSGAAQLHQYTLGLNWYWNRNMKVMFNYEHLHVEHAGTDRDRDANYFVTRFAWDF